MGHPVPSAPTIPARSVVLAELAAVLERRDPRVGFVDLPDGTAEWGDDEAADLAAGRRARAEKAGTCTWRDALDEALAAAYAQPDPVSLRPALIAVMARCAEWVEALDRRRP